MCDLDRVVLPFRYVLYYMIIILFITRIFLFLSHYIIFCIYLAWEIYGPWAKYFVESINTFFHVEYTLYKNIYWNNWEHLYCPTNNGIGRTCTFLRLKPPTETHTKSKALEMGSIREPRGTKTVRTGSKFGGNSFEQAILHADTASAAIRR